MVHVSWKTVKDLLILRHASPTLFNHHSNILGFAVWRISMQSSFPFTSSWKYIYIPWIQMTLVLIGKGCVFGGWPSKIEVIGALGIYIQYMNMYIYISVLYFWIWYMIESKAILVYLQQPNLELSKMRFSKNNCAKCWSFYWKSTLFGALHVQITHRPCP